MPVGFEEYDQLLERAQALVKDQSPESVWALVEEAHLLIARAETAYCKMNDSKVLEVFGRTTLDKRASATNALKDKHKRVVSRRDVSAEIPTLRLLEVTLREYKPLRKRYLLLGSFAVYRLAIAIRSASDRILKIGPEVGELVEDEIIHHSGQNRFVHVSKFSSVAVGERQVVGRLLCDAVEAIAYAEGMAAGSSNGQKANAERSRQKYGWTDPVFEAELRLRPSDEKLSKTAIRIHTKLTTRWRQMGQKKQRPKGASLPRRKTVYRWVIKRKEDK